MGAYPSGEALWREPDHRQLPRLLRARRERPRGRAAERGKEFSSSDVACHVTLRLGVIHAVGDDSTLPSRGAFGPLPARAGLQDIELALVSQEANTPDGGFCTVDRARSRASASPAVGARLRAP
jgi:hypothetical protein